MAWHLNLSRTLGPVRPKKRVTITQAREKGEKEIDRQTEIQVDRQRYRTDRQTEIQVERQTYSTDRHTEIQVERQKYR